MDETAGTTLANQCGAVCGLAVPSSYDLTTHNTPLLNQTGVGTGHGASVNFASASSQYAEVLNNGSGVGPADGGDSATTGTSDGCWVNFGTHAADTLTVISFNTTAVGTNAFNRMYQLVSDSSKANFFLYKNAGVGNGTIMSVTGGTSLVNSTWYLMMASWQATCSGGACSSGHAAVYLNGVSDGTTSTINTGAGNAPDAVVYWDLAALTIPPATPITYLNGNIQDCFVVKHFIDPPEAKVIFELGNGAGDDWPYRVKAPQIPKYRNDGYESKLVDWGYTTGLFSTRTRKPLLIGPYPVLAVVPSGNIN